jgi:hypothetical protein
MAWFVLQIVVLLMRGPHVEQYTWFGYEGGLEARGSVVAARQRERRSSTATVVAESEQNEKHAPTDTSVGHGIPSLDGTAEIQEIEREEKDPSQFV